MLFPYLLTTFVINALSFPDVYFVFQWLLISVSYYCICYCTTLNICVCHFVLIKRYHIWLQAGAVCRLRVRGGLGRRGHVSCWRHRLVLHLRRCQPISAGSPRLLVVRPRSGARAGLPCGRVFTNVSANGSQSSTVCSSAINGVDRWFCRRNGDHAGEC